MKRSVWILFVLMIAVLLVGCSNSKEILPVGTDTPVPVINETTVPDETEEPTEPPATPEPHDETQAPTVTPPATPDPIGNDSPGNGKEEVKVKAVYVSGHVASARLDHFIDLVNKTELNALVIDIKEAGYVNYISEVPLVAELGLHKKIYNVEEVLQKCHENNIYVIGRIVCFRDDGLSSKKKEYAIKKPDGSVWIEGKYGSWADPSIPEVQSYNIDIAKEAVELGFDEIQFDYVRFPTTRKNEVSYSENMPSKEDVISGYLKRASEEIKQVRPVPLSADVFGIIAESVTDGKAIGQNIEMVGMYIDYISPMIYPSHYANNSNGTMGNGVGQKINGVLFTHPDLHPYDVIYQSLLKLKSRIEPIEGYKAKVRPYLQDFTATYLPGGYYQEYGVKQIQEQIKAVYDAGYDEWILWDGRNTYTENALKEDSGQ